MITRGSKYFYGASAIAFVTALVYGFITGASAHGGVIAVFQDGSVVDSIVGPLTFGWKGWVGDQLGYSTLMGFAGIMAVLGGFQTAFRDGGAETIIPLQGEGVTAETADLRVVTPQGLSPWPIAGALSAGLIVVGLAMSSATFIVGVILLAIVAIQWTVRAWSERLTLDPEQNAKLRGKLMDPINIPVGGIVLIGLVMFLVSRILLALPATASVFFIIVVAAAIFGVAVLLGSRPDLKRSVSLAVLIVGALLLIAGGIAGGMAGSYNGDEHGGGSEEGAALNPSGPEIVLNLGSVDGNGASNGY
ncbi:MAG TPA: hypothetical protein VL068_04705 [Microthrixaceae bacterium]|nr:hypothetical protein [Microthrixaceae bacterium]